MACKRYVRCPERERDRLLRIQKESQIALMHRGYTAGKRRISRIMKENGWLRERKRRPKGLTRATTEIQEKENLIKQEFRSDQPYQKLLTDISQIACRDGKL